MFEEFNGLPLHALAVHAPVVLVPLLVLASVLYAVVPRLRGPVWLAAVFLAVVAPLSVLVAKLSGDAFAALAFPELPEAVVSHRSLGTELLWSATALGLLTLALVGIRRGGAASQGRNWVAIAVTVLLLGAAAVSAIWVFRTGDSGAQMIWYNRLPA